MISLAWRRAADGHDEVDDRLAHGLTSRVAVEPLGGTVPGDHGACMIGLDSGRVVGRPARQATLCPWSAHSTSWFLQWSNSSVRVDSSSSGAVRGPRGRAEVPGMMRRCRISSSPTAGWARSSCAARARRRPRCGRASCSMEEPELVRDLHAEFIRAGCARDHDQRLRGRRPSASPARAPRTCSRQLQRARDRPRRRGPRGGRRGRRADRRLPLAALRQLPPRARRSRSTTRSRSTAASSPSRPSASISCSARRWPRPRRRAPPRSPRARAAGRSGCRGRSPTIPARRGCAAASRSRPPRPRSRASRSLRGSSTAAGPRRSTRRCPSSSRSAARSARTPTRSRLSTTSSTAAPSRCSASATISARPTYADVRDGLGRRRRDDRRRLLRGRPAAHRGAARPPRRGGLHDRGAVGA